MSLELIKESIRLNQVVGEDSTQTVFENDIIVPDVKPDITNILIMDGDIFVENAEAKQDKVVIYGIINYKILYLSDEDQKQVKSINTNADFSYTMDILDAAPGMNARVTCDIEHIEYDILNGRKLKAKTIVKMTGKVFGEVEKAIINDLDGMPDIQIQKDNQSVNSYLGRNEVDYTVKETFEIPSGKPTVREILRSDVKISGKDFRIADNKIIAKGDLNVSTLYIADDETRSIQSMEHEIPFTQFVELYGINESSICDLDFNFKGYRFEAVEDSDGELRHISGDVELKIMAAAYEKKNLQLINDAYSPKARLALEKETYTLKEYCAENKSQIVLKDTLSIQDEKPEISEVLNVFCKPVLLDAVIMDDKVAIEGVINNNVLYLPNDEAQPVQCCQQEVPFKQNLDMKGIHSNMDVNIDLDIEHCNYSMVSANEVEVRLVVAVTAKAINQTTIPVLAKVTEQPLDDKRMKSQPSITIYFTQSGDTLWKIAKKYFITVDEIQKLNVMNEKEAILPGQKVLIPKRLV